MVQLAEVERIARQVFVDEFGGDAALFAVTVSEDLDHEGDPIFRVLFVYDTPTERLDAAKAVNVVSRMPEELFAASEPRYPIVSFVSRSDFERASPEAA